MIPFVLGYNLFLGMNVENYDKKIIIHSLLGKADKTRNPVPSPVVHSRVLQGRPDKPVVAWRHYAADYKNSGQQKIANFSL